MRHVLCSRRGTPASVSGSRFCPLRTRTRDAADLVRETLSCCDGVAAVDDDGTLMGFLTSFESIPDPNSPMARYAPERG